ncbi:hypothetical protein WN943_023707 [Citrus x changshan-huyou]
MVSTIPLKLCRLYLSAFEIFTRQLYQLWIAEGFIPDNSEKTAEDYLEPLISSGFIEVKKRRAGGTIKTCYISLFTRGVLALVAQFVEFVHVVPFKLRADRSLENFKRLSEYPSGISKLLLVKYLKLNIPSLKHLPSSLCNLLSLHTLDMPASYIHHTPDGIWKMYKLRHLNFGSVTLPAHPGKFCSSLENLNFISVLHPSSCTQDILGRLPSLQTLRVHENLSSYQFMLSNSLCALLRVESLKLVDDRTIVSQPSSMVPPEYQFPPRLVELSLSILI